MKPIIFTAVLISLTCFTTVPFANDVFVKDYWRCVAHDNNQKQWEIQSLYSVSARNRALEACKKESRLPASCLVIDTTDCEGYSNGRSIRPTWECTAIDQIGGEWHNQPNTQQDDAALSALTHCKKLSSVPDSCYVNMLTCNNLNKR